MAVLGCHHGTGFSLVYASRRRSLVEVSRRRSLVEVCRLLVAAALFSGWGARALGHTGFSRCAVWAQDLGLPGSGTQAQWL